MFKSYLKIAFRNLLKSKVFSFINVFSLSIGIACCILIFLFVRDEWSYDDFHENADQIYRLALKEDYGENNQHFNTLTPLPMGQAVADYFPEIEKYARIAARTDIVRYGDINFSERYHLVDKEFFEVFSFQLLKGDSQKQAEKIQKEVQNLKKIINDFLHYARPGSSKKESCTIKEVFDDAAALLARELNGVAVDFNETKKATTVWVDPQHLKQIFLNLLKNSVQALNGSGDISLEAKDEDSMVQLTFSDNGPGISPEIREQIFEPFFTNRKDGTGLGLAIVKSLVEENGGEIEIKKGEEAIFQISLRKE